MKSSNRRTLKSLKSFDDMCVNDGTVYRETVAVAKKKTQSSDKESTIRLHSKRNPLSEDVRAFSFQSTTDSDSQEESDKENADADDSWKVDDASNRQDCDDKVLQEDHVESTDNIMVRRKGVSPPTISFNSIPRNGSVPKNIAAPLSPVRSCNDVYSFRDVDEDDIGTTRRLARAKAKSECILRKRPSQDDICIVKTARTSLMTRMFSIRNPVGEIKHSFPSFNVFKNNVKNKKKDLYKKYMIDSEILYDLLDNLHWSLSFQPDERKELTRKLLSGQKSTFDRNALQKKLRL